MSLSLCAVAYCVSTFVSTVYVTGSTETLVHMYDMYVVHVF